MEESPRPSSEDNDASYSGSEEGFAAVDFSDVDFDVGAENSTVEKVQVDLTNRAQCDLNAISVEQSVAMGHWTGLDQYCASCPTSCLAEIVSLLAAGQYAEVLLTSSAQRLFWSGICHSTPSQSVSMQIRKRVFEQGSSITACVELELIGVAALNLFLQSNYTGPMLDNNSETLSMTNPHDCFKDQLCFNGEMTVIKNEEKDEKLSHSGKHSRFHNGVLSELAVEGCWPCQVCNHPYYLLVARSILLSLADPTRSAWTYPVGGNASDTVDTVQPSASFVEFASLLSSAPIWCARSAVTHQRLLQGHEATTTLWNEVTDLYQRAFDKFCGLRGSPEPDLDAAKLFLELGIAHHQFDRPGKGKSAFLDAQLRSGLSIHVTGSEGRRTKYQKKATAQMLVKASSATATTLRVGTINDGDLPTSAIKEQMVEHSEDGILLDRIRFEDDKENEVANLSLLDQAILLAMCLDVKNSNPSDGLTAEEMGAYLARVLDHHDDWMLYSTALLERAWLEFERSHTRERAVLQMQALADQQTDRLSITQSTRKSIEESAPVQDRLRMLHYIVYPPRWSILQDLADRYAALGIVTSAAELYSEIESWDDAVDCYRRAGKVSTAEKIVRERLEIMETPRMLKALGDLTDNPTHYERAVSLSNGRFADAYVALGAYHFNNGDLAKAEIHYEQAVKVRPLLSHVWFRLGTVAMQLDHWDAALKAFSMVVQQEPEEAEAWANVAAIHMHKKQPSQAYPALVESLKHNRNNWRVWVSKLYTCLDLAKYDEALLACNMLLDLREMNSSSQGVPALEARFVRAIIGGSLKSFQATQSDGIAMESSRRTLSRAYQLLKRLSASADVESWVYETMAFYHEHVGQSDEILEDLMKEYRSLQAVPSWEKDDIQIRRVCGVVSHIVDIQVRDGSRENLSKAKFLARGVVSRIDSSRLDDPSVPSDVANLRDLLQSIEQRLENQIIT